MVSGDSGQLCAPRAWGCSFGKDRRDSFRGQMLENNILCLPIAVLQKA